jgi:hypothetical protein
VERAGQAQEVATITRRPVSPLLASEAQQLGGMLAALPVAEQGRRIAQMADVLPAPMMLALANQIGGDDKGARRALALQMQFGAAKTTAGRYRSELVARGAQVIRDKPSSACGRASPRRSATACRAVGARMRSTRRG